MTGTSDLTLYNAGHKGKERRLLADAFPPAPVSGEIPTPIAIRKIDKGRFGWRATATVSKIAGGAGSITGYAVRTGKRFLTATCGDGRLQLRAVSTFVDGTRLVENSIRTCAVAEADARQ
jgi:hypothetical protein